MTNDHDVLNSRSGGRRAVVLICTAGRPQMLRDCIRSVLTQQIPSGWSFEIGIIENDSEPRSRSIVDELAASSAVPIHYVQEVRRGIPFARNRSVQLALDGKFDWLVLIDDDEVAQAGWLSALIAAQEKYEAAVLTGPVEFLYEVPPPDWWRGPAKHTQETGDLLKQAATNNTMLSAILVRQDGLNLRFDEAFASGSDSDFFRQAHAAGAKIVFVREAVVEERVPASRLTNRRVLQRIQTQSASLAFSKRLRKGGVRIVGHLGVNGVLRVCTGGFLALAAAPFYLAGFKNGRCVMFRGLERLFKGLGNLRGLTRYRPTYYSTIDGR